MYTMRLMHRIALAAFLALVFLAGCAHTRCESSSAVVLQFQHDSGGEFPIMQQLIVHGDGLIDGADGGVSFCGRAGNRDQDFTRLLALLQDERTAQAMRLMAERNRAQMPSGEFFRITVDGVFVLVRPAALEEPVGEIVKLADSVARKALGRRWLSVSEGIR